MKNETGMKTKTQTQIKITRHKTFSKSRQSTLFFPPISRGSQHQFCDIGRPVETSFDLLHRHILRMWIFSNSAGCRQNKENFLCDVPIKVFRSDIGAFKTNTAQYPELTPKFKTFDLFLFFCYTAPTLKT